MFALCLFCCKDGRYCVKKKIYFVDTDSRIELCSLTIPGFVRMLNRGLKSHNQYAERRATCKQITFCYPYRFFASKKEAKDFLIDKEMVPEVFGSIQKKRSYEDEYRVRNKTTGEYVPVIRVENGWSFKNKFYKTLTILRNHLQT